MKKLSALLTTYNRAALLPSVLKSVEHQSLSRSDYEIIVVDDGSSDCTQSVIEGFVGKLPLLYVRQENCGLAAARNHGLARANGQIILMLDDDDCLDPDTLAQHLSSHHEHPSKELAVLGHTELDSTISRSPVMRFSTKVSGHLFSYRDLSDGELYGFEHFWGGRTSFKRQFVIESGGFNTAFKFGCEDIELGYRLSKRGLKVRYNSKAISTMIRGVEFLQFCRRLWLQGRSQHLFASMYDDEIVRTWCEVPAFEREWPVMAGNWPLVIERASRIDQWANEAVAAGVELSADTLKHLHWCYWEAFKASKFAGIAGEYLP